MAHLTIELPDALDIELRAAASRRAIDVSQLIRDAVTGYLRASTSGEKTEVNPPEEGGTIRVFYRNANTGGSQEPITLPANATLADLAQQKGFRFPLDSHRLAVRINRRRPMGNPVLKDGDVVAVVTASRQDGAAPVADDPDFAQEQRAWQDLAALSWSQFPYEDER